MSLGLPYRNPYEVTALQIAAVRVQALFRARHRQLLEHRLALSDHLLGQVERCRMEGRRYVATAVWQQTAALATEVDPALRGKLANNRHPDQVAEVIFALQGQLLATARGRRGQMARVIPLFPAG